MPIWIPSRMLAPLLAPLLALMLVLTPVLTPTLTPTQTPVLAPMTVRVLVLSIEAATQQSPSTLAAFGHAARCCVWMRL